MPRAREVAYLFGLLFLLALVLLTWVGKIGPAAMPSENWPAERGVYERGFDGK